MIIKLSKLVDFFENFVTGTALVVIVGSVIWGVLTRYITDQPAVWTSETSGIFFTWVVFIGAMSAHRRNAHVNVPMLVDSLRPTFKRFIQVISDIIIFFFVSYSAYLSFGMMIKGASRPSAVTGIPFSYVYLAPLVAFVVMGLHSAYHLLRLIYSTVDNKETDTSTNVKDGGSGEA